LPSCTAMTRAEPRCRDRVCRDDRGRPMTRYTAMSRDDVGRLHRALGPTSDRSQQSLPTFAGLLLPCIPGLDMVIGMCCFVPGNLLTDHKCFWQFD
jgi:hypothetical protein